MIKLENVSKVYKGDVVASLKTTREKIAAEAALATGGPAGRMTPAKSRAEQRAGEERTTRVIEAGGGKRIIEAGGGKRVIEAGGADEQRLAAVLAFFLPKFTDHRFQLPIFTGLQLFSDETPEELDDHPLPDLRSGTTDQPSKAGSGQHLTGEERSPMRQNSPVLVHAKEVGVLEARENLKLAQLTNRLSTQYSLEYRSAPGRGYGYRFVRRNLPGLRRGRKFMC